jgi:hypothetical protein
VRSPEPWNQQTSRSPLGSSTIEDEWLCHFPGEDQFTRILGGSGRGERGRTQLHSHGISITKENGAGS